MNSGNIEADLKDKSLLEMGYIRFCWIWKMSIIAFPFVSWISPVMATGIPTCEFETRLDFSLYSEHMVDMQVASKPFDVH